MRKNEPRTGGRSLFPVFQQIKNYRLMWSGDFATHSSAHLCILVCCFFVIFLLSPPSSFASSPNLTADERQYLLDYFKEFPNCTSKIDAVRVFVYNSSLHAEPMDKDGWKTILTNLLQCLRQTIVNSAGCGRIFPVWHYAVSFFAVPRAYASPCRLP